MKNISDSAPLLSILVPTVPSRLHTFFPQIMDCLIEQTSMRSDVELIGLFDNKMRSLGEKRNDLLGLANGRYLTFIDDDDSVADDYVEQIWVALKTNPDADLVVYDVLLERSGRAPVHCHYDVSITRGRNVTNSRYEGPPAHTHVWRSELAKKYSFPEMNFGEDTAWTSQAARAVKKQVRINKVLYHYIFDPNTSETRG